MLFKYNIRMNKYIFILILYYIYKLCLIKIITYKNFIFNAQEYYYAS